MFSHILRKTFRKERGETEYDEYISEFVYGGIDGTITSFAVVAGATGARLDLSIILILGIGSLVADGLSMGVGSFFSKKAENDLAAFKRNGSIEESTAGFVKSPALAGLITFGSFAVIGVIPLIVYIMTIFLEIEHLNLFFISSVGTAISLSIIGVLKSFVTKKSVMIGVGETLLLGGIAAVAAYYIGFFLEQLLS